MKNNFEISKLKENTIARYLKDYGYNPEIDNNDYTLYYGIRDLISIGLDKQKRTIDRQIRKFNNLIERLNNNEFINASELALILCQHKLGRNKLLRYLREEKILQSDNRPYRKWEVEGYCSYIPQKSDGDVIGYMPTFSLKFVVKLFDMLPKILKKKYCKDIVKNEKGQLVVKWKTEEEKQKILSDVYKLSVDRK